MSLHTSLTLRESGLLPGLELDDAARWLRRGGVLVFPTETFYGLGCLATEAEAVARVYQVKRRPVHKPLPLLAANAAQADLAVDLAAMPEGLRAFWPGPLTVLLPARACLPALLVNDAGLAAVRVTPHPLAARLALQSGGALTASSANLSGGAAARKPEDIDPALLEALLEASRGLAPAVMPQNETAQGPRRAAVPVLLGGPLPAGGKPSTVVEPLAARGGAGTLRVLRAGAVSAAALEAAGFSLV